MLLCISNAYICYSQNADVFQSPPLKYGPYVWWHWAGPNFSEEGITKDLEAMKSAGIGGATLFNITSAVQETHAPTKNNPWPEKTYRSEAYWKAVRHAAQEASRLGLELGLHNTVGYSTTGGPWINEERGMQCVVKTCRTVEGGKLIDIMLEKGVPPIYKGWGSFRKKASTYNDIAVYAVPAEISDAGTDDAIDITKYMDKTGRLRWNAPSGSWNIYRIGYAPTMANPHPVPDDLIGKVLEVDKINAKQNKFHWNEVLVPLKKNLGSLIGKSFKHILIDSYEAGKQDWTCGFRDKFIKIKKYDPVPWLTGQIGTEEERRRFKYDYNDVIARLYYSEGFKTGADIIHGYRMQLQFEPYGGPFNTLSCTSLADIPMGEFWTNGNGSINQNVVSAARAEGKRIIGAEAFTSRPENSAWTEDPEFLKFSADGAYCSGANRLVLHHWVHQPFDDKYQPGLSMGWWGTHFNRHQTWFEPGKAFFSYLTRIQYMLQQGEEIIEYLCLDKVVGRADAVSSDRFLEMDIKVENGNLVLPSGRTYKYLVCPELNICTPELARKLVNLSKKGITIVGKRPEKSPSLTDFPLCDNEVRELGMKLDLCSSIEEARKRLNIKPEIIVSPDAKNIKTLIRRCGNGRIVFLANRSPEEQNVVLSVKIENMLPEIWDPETGKTEDAESWRFNKEGYTEIDMSLCPNKTVFLVLKEKADEEQIRSGMLKKSVPTLKCATAVRGAWDVEFHPKLDNNFSLQFDQLADFKYNTDKRVMYFSGTAIYRKTVDIKEGDLADADVIYLSLGKVCDIARVRINGKDAGVWWYAPYRKNIAGLLKAGKNEIEIEVTNNWANRLIGDEQEPADFEWGTDRGASMGRAMKAYPEWFIENKPRPSQRKAFVIWYYHKADSPLQSAGLIGPVTFEYYKR